MNKKTTNQALGITEVVLRDAHQSLIATRLRIEDMLPIAPKLDQVGFWSVESWGGATFDACIRYLGEDPWERLRAIKKAMPKTRQQMLLRGQNLLGYRHYADDVVRCFVQRAAENGVDVFRIFDAMNDVRNLKTAIEATLETGKHAQGVMCYTLSPVHNIENWIDLGKRLEDTGVDSIAIKDMAGLLDPYTAYELVHKLKQTVAVPIHMQSHATTGMSTATNIKAIEAGIDNVDTAISSMSMTTGHSATESVVAIMRNQARDTGLDLELLIDIAAYFRKVRKKYAAFEGSLRGVDSRILQAQVPGGMLSNMENQLKEQNALDRIDDVFKEIPKVRKDLGYIPMVTPTSQIIGTQAVMNVLSGERYKSISTETAGVLKGEYGATASTVNATLQKRVLKAAKQAKPITCRPADLLKPEMDSLTKEVIEKAANDKIKLAKNSIDDILTYALLPQVGWYFLKHRGQKDAFEPAPVSAAANTGTAATPSQTSEQANTGHYQVSVDGKVFDVTVGNDTQNIGSATMVAPKADIKNTATANNASGQAVNAPMTGTVHQILVTAGQSVAANQIVAVLEAMKMEIEVRTTAAGTVQNITVNAGDKINSGQALMTVS